MTITISGRAGESKTCVANIIRQALENAGAFADGFGDGGIRYVDAKGAAIMLDDKLKITVIEEKKP